MPRNLRPIPNFPTIRQGKLILRHRQKGYQMNNYLVPKSILQYLMEHGPSTVSQMVTGIEFAVIEDDNYNSDDDEYTVNGISRGTLNQALDAMEDACIVEGSGGRGQVWELTNNQRDINVALVNEILESNHTSSRVCKRKDWKRRLADLVAAREEEAETPKASNPKAKVVKTDLSFDGSVIDENEKEVPLDMKRRYVVIADLLYMAPKGLTWLGIDGDGGHHWERSERDAIASSLYEREIGYPGMAIKSVSAKEALAQRDSYIEEWQAEREAEEQDLTQPKKKAKVKEQPKDEIAEIVARFKSKIEKVK